MINFFFGQLFFIMGKQLRHIFSKFVIYLKSSESCATLIDELKNCINNLLKNSMNMVTHGNIGTFPFVYSLVCRSNTVPNVNIDFPMIKQESSWQRVRY